MSVVHGVIKIPLPPGDTTKFLRGDETWATTPAGGSPPTGTGFRHVTGGVEDAASKLVDTADINADQVTYAKMQNVSAASKLLGRGSAAGGGDTEEITLGTNLSMSGTTINAAGGSGNFGTAVVDFGAFPGGSDASVAVTGQTGIVAGSKVNAWLRLEASADHSADEHWVESIRIFAGNIVAGTGFTIYARNDSELNEPLAWAHPEHIHIASSTAGQNTAQMAGSPWRGGQGTRLYGVFNLQWQWA